VNWFYAFLGVASLIGIAGLISDEARAWRARRVNLPRQERHLPFAIVYLAPVVAGAIAAIHLVLT
jgi:hypothetical protein